MKKKLRSFILIFGFIIFVVSGLIVLFWNNADLLTGYLDLKKTEKNKFGGIIINNTMHNITVTDWRITKVIPPGKSSRDLNIFDADSLIIGKITIYENLKYDNGIIKICDFSTITVESKGDFNYIKPSFLHNICKFFNKTGWYKTVEEAFPNTVPQ